MSQPIDPKIKPDAKGASLSNGKRIETSQQRYIRLLRMLATVESPMFTDPDEPIGDLLAFEELLGSDFISGSRQGNEVDRVIGVYNRRGQSAACEHFPSDSREWDSFRGNPVVCDLGGCC
jgi:hypothetical protein